MNEEQTIRRRADHGYFEAGREWCADEWLDQNVFETIEEAQEQATNWLWTYNNDRPNMAIGGITELPRAMKLKMAA